MNNTLIPAQNDPATLAEDLACIVVGIDINEEGDFARLVYGNPKRQFTADGPRNLSVLGWKGFRDVDRFARYWTLHLEDGPRASSFLVAIPRYSWDAIGIVDWLGAKGISVYCSYLGEYDPRELEKWGLPQTFGNAYDLCQQMACRHNAEDTLADSWYRLADIKRALQQVTDELGNLKCAQSANLCPPNFCPF